MASRQGNPLPLASLVTNSLFIVLTRDLATTPDAFYWSFYLHKDAVQGGTKFVLKREGGGWIVKVDPTKAATETVSLIGLIRIADVLPAHIPIMNQIITQNDNWLHHINGLTSQRWVRAVCENLAGQSPPLVNLQNWAALEQQVVAFGSANTVEDIEQNPQPRPVTFSPACGLTF